MLHKPFFSAFVVLTRLMAAQQTPSPQTSAPLPSVQSSPPVSPDAEIQALQIKLKALELQKQIDALKAQQDATLHPAPSKQPLPPCEATPNPAKSNHWLERLKQKAAQIAAKETNAAGGSIARSTHGTIDGSVIPTPQDVGGTTPKPKSPCQPAVPSTSVEGAAKQ